MEGNIQSIFQKIRNKLVKCSIEDLKKRDRGNPKKQGEKK